MKMLLILVSFFINSSGNAWLTDFDQAKKIAAEKNELILINFSGSDWCGPCIRMKKELFGSEAFINFADNHLVLLNIDFPRNKKNQPDKKQQDQNDQLADKYNASGKFPFTVLITAQGRVIKEWDGFPEIKPVEFIKQITLAGDSTK